MSDIVTIRRNIKVTDSVVDKLFTIQLSNFPDVPEFELLSPGPNPAENALSIANENAFRSFLEEAFSGTRTIPVTQINGEGIGQLKTFPMIMEWQTLEGEPEYENFSLAITLDTVGNSITRYALILSGTNLRGSPPTQSIISMDSNEFT